jgi:Helix-turn-helix domain
MSKRANPMAVKAALTYDVNEAARALDKTPATIRNWIKDGLPVMSSRKPYLISGEAIREYLRAKYKASKRPLDPDTLFCPACGVGRQPVGMEASISSLTVYTSLLKGVCSHCCGTSTRMISKTKVTDFAHTFTIKEEVDSDA